MSSYLVRTHSSNLDWLTAECAARSVSAYRDATKASNFVCVTNWGSWDMASRFQFSTSWTRFCKGIVGCDVFVLPFNEALDI